MFGIKPGKMAKGKLVIISAPSGAGKTTIVKYIMEKNPALGFSVSATSRAPREGESDGVDYHFLTVDDFRSKIDQGLFVEWEEVYPGQYYGTLLSEIERLRSMGKHLVFDVDVKGGINLKRQFGNDAISLFIMPPSVQELESRLRLRGKESEEKIRMRVEKAAIELNDAAMFDVIVVNDNLNKAQNQALDTINTFLNSR
jgi:guanylate kinase